MSWREEWTLLAAEVDGYSAAAQGYVASHTPQYPEGVITGYGSRAVDSRSGSAIHFG